MGLLSGIRFGIGCICGTIVGFIIIILLLLLFLKIIALPWG